MLKRDFKKDLKKLDDFYLFLLNFKNEILDELFLLKKNHTSDLKDGIQTNYFSEELEDLNLKYINRYRDIRAEYYQAIKEILSDESYSDLKRRYYQEKGADVVDMIEHLFEEFDLQSFLDNFVSIITELDSVSNTIKRKQKMSRNK